MNDDSVPIGISFSLLPIKLLNESQHVKGESYALFCRHNCTKIVHLIKRKFKCFQYGLLSFTHDVKVIVS